MLHTATLILRRDLDYYRQVKSLPGCQYDAFKGTFSYYGLRDKGIIIYTGYKKADYSKSDTGYYYTSNVYMFINFERLLDQSDRIRTFNDKDLEAFAVEFDRLMDSIGLPTLEYWDAHRIDYCVNVKLIGTDSGHVADYVRLFKHGRIRHYLRRVYKDKQQKQYDGSCYLVPKSNDKQKSKTGCYIVNIYDKQDECSKKKQSEDVIKQAEDILRIEIQCFKPKLKTLKIKNNYNDMAAYRFLDNDIAKDLLLDEVSFMVGKGDFVLKRHGIKQIEASTYSQPVKQSLIAIYDTATRDSNFGLDKAKANEKHFRDRMDRFDKLGISPIGISDNGKLNTKLTSPYRLLKDALEQDEYRPSLDDKDISRMSNDEVREMLDMRRAEENPFD